MNAINASQPTPVMAQYLDIKAQYPDCLLLFRMGDFYELFFEDAVLAAEALSLALTKRGKHNGEDIPLAGVPAHAADAYIAKLIRLGFRVGVCEQLEDPKEAKKRGSKAVVHRGIVRVITPGTLTEDTLLDERGANRLASLSWRGGVMALGMVELSTGDVECFEVDAESLGGHLSALRPSETLVSERLFADEGVHHTLKLYGGVLQPQGTSLSDPKAAEARLCHLYGVLTLDGFGQFSPSEISALGMLASYIDLTQAGKKPLLKVPVKYQARQTLSIDAATRNSLEIDRTQRGQREGSLIWAVDRTVTSAGARLLSLWLQRPLCDVSAIASRHDMVDHFLARRDIRNDARSLLRSLSDPARAFSRLSLNRGSARDMALIAGAIGLGVRLSGLLDEPFAPPEALGSMVAALRGHDGLARLFKTLEAALVAEPPASIRDGGFIKTGYDQTLDEAKALRDDSRRVVLALETRLQAETGIALKIKYNALMGYFLELTQKQAEQIKALDNATDFIHRQSLSNQTRFVTTELIELDAKIERAATTANALELAIFEQLREALKAEADVLLALFDALSALDVYLAIADWAEDVGAIRPHIDTGSELLIEQGRHPVVAQVLNREGKVFTANDLTLDALGASGPRLCLVTGPNMAGKSTYLRQNALLIILAQAGFFVPCSRMRLGVVDRLFSRVGAGDDLAQGRSTFMMEMVETAAILSSATQNSFVILDEIGRGTATYDGLAIAWACAEALHDKIGCRALFATHYHEMSDLERRLKACENLSLQAREHQGELIFLHAVKKGSADRSYGVQVARLAGMPAAVVSRAKAILERLETDNATKLKLDDLPLFSFDRALDPAPQEDPKLMAALKGLDPDHLSPKEALETLYHLKSLLNKGA